MSSSKPVSYLTLKCLLKNLDPNLRLQLSTTCPSIQHLEKSVPLNLKYLEITSDHITVNRSTFQLKVYNEHDFCNGGYQYDINQNGRIDLCEIEQDPNELRIDIRRDRELERIASLEEAIAGIKQKMNAQNTQNDREDLRCLASLEEEFDKIHREIHHQKVISGGKYIQLTFGGKFEVLSYEKKMHEAMKYLLGKLFGGKIVKVDTFSIGCESVLRIPSTVKFSITNLELLLKRTTGKILELVSHIVEKSCLPLNSLKSWPQCINKIDNFPIARTAKILEVRGRGQMWSLSRLNHRRVHVATLSNWKNSFILEIVDYWMVDDGKEIGTYHTFQMSQKTIDNVMESVCVKYDDKVEARLTQSTDQISLKRDNTSNFVITKFQQGTSWILGMKVEHR